MRIKGWQVGITLVTMVTSALMGILLTLQFRTQLSIKAILPSRRVEELAIMLRETEAKRDSLQQEIRELRKKLGYYEELNIGRNNVCQNLKDELTRVRLAAGFSNVKGSGIVVRLADGWQPLKPKEDPRMSMVHDEDILKVINDLWAADAEAISVNEQRIINRTEITCAGSTILVNKTRIASPYIIKAIGDPYVLESAVKIKGGYLEYLGLLGIEISISKEEDIITPSFNGSLNFYWAESIKEGR